MPLTETRTPVVTVQPQREDSPKKAPAETREAKIRRLQEELARLENEGRIARLSAVLDSLHKEDMGLDARDMLCLVGLLVERLQAAGG